MIAEVVSLVAWNGWEPEKVRGGWMVTLTYVFTSFGSDSLLTLVG